MLRAYLDTNVYYISRIDPNTNSRIAINAAIAEQFKVVQSDHLYDEIQSLFKRTFGKDIAGYQKNFMLSIPLIVIIYENKWSPLIKRYQDLITDIDDLPHICSYFYCECDYFVTTNRRLTQMKIRNKVNFITPKKFVEKLKLNSIDTQNEI